MGGGKKFAWNERPFIRNEAVVRARERESLNAGNIDGNARALPFAECIFWPLVLFLFFFFFRTIVGVRVCGIYLRGLLSGGR